MSGENKLNEENPKNSDSIETSINKNESPLNTQEQTSVGSSSETVVKPESAPVVKKPESAPVVKDRRNFLKTLAVIGGILGLTPFIPYGSFFTSTLGGTKPVRQRIMKDDGRFANVDNIEPDSSVVFAFPRTGDSELDAEPFRRYQLIRLSEQLGGINNDVSAFKVYSMVCVHLWCLWDYIEGREIEINGETIIGNLECPCHGSNYDVRTGVAHSGPAQMQSAPNNALPTLPIEIDDKGDIWVLPPDNSLDENGVIGMGRYVRGDKNPE